MLSTDIRRIRAEQLLEDLRESGLTAEDLEILNAPAPPEPEELRLLRERRRARAELVDGLANVQ